MRSPWGVLSNLWVLDSGNHVLEAICSRPPHLAINGLSHGEGPCHCEPGAPGADTRLSLSGQYAIKSRDCRLDTAPCPLRLTLPRSLEEVWLVQQNESGNSRVP